MQLLTFVKVPVLSEQTVVTQPRVSTVCRPFTKAERWAMRRIPRQSVIVTTMGKPSGIAATAKLTAILKICVKMVM